MAEAWYRDAVIYELHVRAFQDSNDDGVGDFRGLIERLDYLQELGITAIWLLPFFPSPLQDDGYDIADYCDVHPAYGTLDDVKAFLDAAHARGLRVIIELVLNHTSDQHPWFQRARRAPPGSEERNFYVWSDSPERYGGARVIFQDYEHSNWAWDPVAEQYFWHRFYSHQPDLNYDHPPVRKAILEVADFWLELGVDGLRLDAVPYLYERDGTPSENLEPTHGFLKELRAHIDGRFPDRMLLAEANQWPEDAVAYFGEGDECQMAFHFPLMPRLFMALRSEDRFPIVDILAQTPPIPEGCQWALFLRNHDELTLEMVTDEERVSMLRAFARDPEARVNLGIRRRLAPLLGNNRRQIELLNGLLCALPGTPVIYYGDEIGMGDNIFLGDRDSVRTPMQWGPDRNAGFSRAKPQQLYLPLITDYEYHHEALQVEAQQQNPHSLLHWMRRLLAVRRRSRAFGRGDIRFLQPENQKVLAFVREHDGECVLVVANLSRFFQHVQLDLGPFAGSAPIELFGQTRLPPIADEPYVLTLGPHAFHWFALSPAPLETADPVAAQRPAPPPQLAVAGAWTDLLTNNAQVCCEEALPAFLRAQQWLPRKERPMLAAQIVEAIPLPDCPDEAHLVIVEVEYAEGDPERYCLPLAFATGEAAKALRRQPGAVVAHVRAAKRSGVLYDGLAEPAVVAALFDTIVEGRQLRGHAGTITGSVAAQLRRGWARIRDAAPLAAMPGRQNNTSLRIGDIALLKLFRRLADGLNPEVEVGQLLDRRGFAAAAPLLGTMSYSHDHGVPTTLAVIHAVVDHRGTLWEQALNGLGTFFELVEGDAPPPLSGQFRARGLLDESEVEAPPEAHKLIGTMLAVARLLGRRTAELHTALADPDDPAFAPEPFTPHYQRSLHQSFRGLVGRVFRSLRASLPGLPEPVQEQARAALEKEPLILRRLERTMARPLKAQRIRCHGDFHLGQALRAGKDIVFIDFEGESGTPVLERQLKHSPLWDLAGMLQSIAYVAQVRLLDEPEDEGRLARWAGLWHRWVSASFVHTYLTTESVAALLPGRRDDAAMLLDAYLLQKALYALGYELSHRPEWVPVALRCLRQLVEAPD